MNQDLHALCDAVNSRESFVLFINALGSDYMQNKDSDQGDDKGWENDGIGMFLNAIAVYGATPQIKEEASWNNFAKMIFAGKWYE